MIRSCFSSIWVVIAIASLLTFRAIAIPCDLYSNGRTCVAYNRATGYINICPAVDTFWNELLNTTEIHATVDQQIDGSDARCISINPVYVSEYRTFTGYIDYFTAGGEALHSMTFIGVPRTIKLKTGTCNPNTTQLDLCAPGAGATGSDPIFSQSRNALNHVIEVSMLPLTLSLSATLNKTINIEVWLFQTSGSVSLGNKYWYAEAGSVAIVMKADGYEFTNNIETRQIFSLEFLVRTYGLASLKVWINHEMGPIPSGSTSSIVDISDGSLRIMKDFVHRTANSSEPNVRSLTVDTRLRGDLRVLSLMFSPAPFDGLGSVFFVPPVGSPFASNHATSYPGKILIGNLILSILLIIFFAQ